MFRFKSADADGLDSPILGSEPPGDGDGRRPGGHPCLVYGAALAAVLGCLCLGYDTVLGASVLLQQLEDEFALDDDWQLAFNLLPGVATAVFAIVGGLAAELIGRRWTIFSGGVTFACGALLLAVSQGATMMLFGRFFTGAAKGLMSVAIPIYIAEIAPAEVRGRLLSMFSVFCAAGAFAGVGVLLAFSHLSDGWRYTFAIGGIPAILQAVASFLMPESPRWLTSSGSYDRAKEALLRLRRHGKHAEQEFDDMRQSEDDSSKARLERGGGWAITSILRTSYVRRMLAIGCFLQVIHEFSGLYTVMYLSGAGYNNAASQQPPAGSTPASSGSNNNQPPRLSIRPTAIAFFVSFIGVYLVEKIGRRPLTLVSLAGICCSCLLLAASYHFSATRAALNAEAGAAQTVQQVPSYAWLAIMGYVSFLFFYAPGLGSMAFVVSAEISPQWARSTSNAITACCYWICNLVISLTFLSFSEMFKGVFYLYAVVAALSFIFVFLCLPETKGRPLEEIEGLFAQSWLSGGRQFNAGAASGNQSSLSITSSDITYLHIKGHNKAFYRDETVDCD